MKNANNNSQTNFLSASRARHKLGVCSKTLRNWESKGHINTIRTPAGVRLYDVESMLPTTTGKSKESGHRIIYARVSSAKQKGDLERQIQFMSEKFPEHKVVRDIGSGINWTRPGLRTILRYCLDGSIREIVVAHRDRLSRLGFELLQFIVEEAGGRIVVCGESEGEKTGEGFQPESELGEDLLSIIHVFSSRHYGRRKYKNRVNYDKQQQKTKDKEVGKVIEGGENSQVQENKDNP